MAAVETGTDAAASLRATDRGYEGVAGDMDVVAFLSALLDETGAYEVKVPEAIAEKARIPIERMISITP